MRINCKGINRVTKRLANGTEVTYYYAWKGGPRVLGQYGSPEFIASYLAACAQKRPSAPGRILRLLQNYQTSAEFEGLAQRTRFDYVKQIKLIERKFGDFPLEALSDRRTRGLFMAWRDELAARSRRQADYTFSVFARVLSWALNRGLCNANPIEKTGRLYRAFRNERVWTATDEAAFLESAPAHLHLPLLLALWTGQRQGDLLRLPWSSYDGKHIRMRQSKTGKRVVIPVGTPLKRALDSTPKRSTIVLVNSDGKPWTPDGFRSSWGKAVREAKIVGLTFHDLRGTAVTRLALLDASEAEIATFTGLSLRDVGAILDAHYLNRDLALAESAVKKLESGTVLPN